MSVFFVFVFLSLSLLTLLIFALVTVSFRPPPPIIHTEFDSMKYYFNFCFFQVVLPATYLVIGPLQLTVVCYLLWDWLELGPVALAGVVVLLLLFPLQVFMGKLSQVLR